jgi:hypothetical protein
VSRALGPRARTEVQRILDGAARRLLAEEIDGDPLRSATARDGDALDDRADQVAPLVEGEPVPVRGRRDRHRGGKAA